MITSPLSWVDAPNVYPLAGDEAIKSDYGAVTRLIRHADLKLYVLDREDPAQPRGWPLSPMRKDCR
jgi:hypothetical protein